MRDKCLVVILCLLPLAISRICFADTRSEEMEEALTESPGAVREQKILEAIEILSGYGWGKTKYEDSYSLVPVILSFDFNLKRLFSKLGNPNTPLMQLQFETSYGVLTEPRSNWEGGFSFFLKFGVLPQNFKIQPYLKLGFGLDYISAHMHGVSTHTNYISTAGLGLHYFFMDNLGLTLEGRYRHLSNGGRKAPNSGINTTSALGGFCYNF